MTKRLTALGFALVGVVWGPYVYAELARKPLTPVASEPAPQVIEPTPVSYVPPAQERAQLMAALAEPHTAAAAPEQPVPAEPALAEPAAVDPAAPEVAEPAALPPAAANAETIAAAATDPALAAAQPAAAPEAAPQPAAAADPSTKPDEPAHAAAKEVAEGEAKHEEHSDDRHDEKAEKADDKHEATATPESLAPAFRSAFDRESRDAAWANGEEPRLAQMFAGAGVPASAIGEVRCQSTVCRVALTSVDAKAVQQSPLYQLLYQRVRDEFGTLGLDATGSDGEQHAAFYVLRKGAELSRDTN